MIKTCQNCACASSSSTTAVSPYYCFAHRLYVNPIGCCPLYMPNGGYETNSICTDEKEKNDEGRY